MAARTRFPPAVIQALQDARILGIRAGRAHRFTAVWVVVVEGRLFVRSWDDKPTGWFQAFRADPRGTIEVAGREMPVRAKQTSGLLARRRSLRVRNSL
jgi:hypothetical protein